MEVEELRGLSSEVSPLNGSPEREPPRECECCGDIMSPKHQCETPPEQEPSNCVCCGEVISPKKCQAPGCGNQFSCETQLKEHMSHSHTHMWKLCNESFKEWDEVHKDWEKNGRKW